MGVGSLKNTGKDESLPVFTRFRIQSQAERSKTPRETSSLWDRERGKKALVRIGNATCAGPWRSLPAARGFTVTLTPVPINQREGARKSKDAGRGTACPRTPTPQKPQACSRPPPKPVLLLCSSPGGRMRVS